VKQGIQSKISNPNISEFGCYFLDILRWAEIDTGKDFDEIDISAIYNEAVRLGFMRSDCFIENAPQIYWLASGEKKYCHIKKTNELPDHPTFIICQKKPMYTHFVISHNGDIWDSLDPNRPGAKGYKPDSYRVFV
jgi:hypothetical protein